MSQFRRMSGGRLSPDAATVARVVALCVATMFGTMVSAAPAAAQAPPAAPPPTTVAADQKPLFKPEELDQMLAPIALYNDALLSQVLMAATYPLEVVEAARWVKANPNLKGDAAVKAVHDKSWDVSVKSLVAFPQVLLMMNDRLEWTQKLGDALLSQQKDVAASVQRLRKLSYDAGNLKTSDQQKVNVQPAAQPGAPQTIIIEPSSPESVYVPVYQPSWAYGTWPYPSYPPTYYPPYPGYGYGAPLARGFMFGVGVAAAGSMFGGWNWGSGDMNVNVNRAVNIDRNFDGNRYQNGRWNHQVDHRKGVGYRDAGTRQRYGKNVAGADARNDFRGKDLSRPVGTGGQRAGGQVGGGRPGGGQVGGGQRPGGGQVGGGQRPGGGQVGGGQRPGGGQVGGGQRPGGGQVGGGQRPGGYQGGGHHGGAVGGVDRGGQRVNREAARGRSSAGGHRGGGGGGRGGGGRGGGGGRR